MTEELPKALAAVKKAYAKVKVSQPTKDLAKIYLGTEKEKREMVGKVIKFNTPDGDREAAERKAATSRLMDICEKLEKTYAKDRKSPKNALAKVYLQTHEFFGGAYPIRDGSPSDVSSTLLIQLMGRDTRRCSRSKEPYSPPTLSKSRIRECCPFYPRMQMTRTPWCFCLGCPTRTGLWARYSLSAISRVCLTLMSDRS